MGASGEKRGDEEKEQKTSKTTSFVLDDYTVVKEGEAEVLMATKNLVFYNKPQVYNRDMSIAVLRTFISKRKQEHEALLSKRAKTAAKVKHVSKAEASVDSIIQDGRPNGECEALKDTSQHKPCNTSDKTVENLEEKSRGELKSPRVLEALSASGLRALRYALEVEGIGQVVALDIDKASVEACRRNIKFNGSAACSKAESHLADARIYMLTDPKEFDVVDLDPYGTPSIFLKSALQSVVDGGLLICTATDMAVLCGNNGEVCYSKYGSYPLRGMYCHEMALRILLASIESHANLCSTIICSDELLRAGFLRVYISASAMKNTPLKLSYLYQCTGCDSFHLQPLGQTVSKELPDVPLFLSLYNLCATLKCTSPSAVVFHSSVISAGYHISGTHVDPLGLKTDAPMDIIWDIMRCWVRNHSVKSQPPEQAGSVILAKEPVLQANFARAVASLSKAARFLPNPERHWGPKLRAGRQITTKHVSLLGADAVNGVINHEDSNEPATKRKKTEDPTHKFKKSSLPMIS